MTAMEQLLGGDTEACSEEELDALDYVTGPSSAAAGEDDGADDEPGHSEVPVSARRACLWILRSCCVACCVLQRLEADFAALIRLPVHSQAALSCLAQPFLTAYA